MVTTTELKTLRAENKKQKTEIEYLKGKVAFLYAEIARIALHTVAVDSNPKRT